MNDYLEKLRPAFPNKSESELELLCSSSKGLWSKTGLSGHEHRKRAMEKLFPSRIWHDWREQRIASVQYCLEHRIQELMWIGSSNSNKSADMADVALALWWTKPELTTIYVTSPYESATETGLWAYIVEQFEEAKANNPSLPGKRRLSDNSIILYDRNPRSFIRVVTVDQIGKMVGKKAKSFDQGLMIILADELPAFLALAARNFVSVTANLRSVPNLLIIGAGNFASTSDALGIFCDPDESEIPLGYDGFDPDRHFRWKTKRGGLVLRFDGLQSPNVKAGRDIYPFVTTLKYIELLAAGPGGLNSPDAMRYIRSAPITSLDEFGVTSTERIRAGGALEPFEWTEDALKLGAFIDPGFGGDPCILWKFKFGTMALPGGKKRPIIAMWEPPVEIPVRIHAKNDDGTEYTVNDQIADQCRDHCRAKGIPDHHVGYDGSLRSGIVQSFARKWSTQVEALDSVGPATDRPIDAKKTKKWKEHVDRFLSELWFAAASLIDSGQLRGLDLSPKAQEQLKARRWAWQGRRRKVQTKPEYKEMLVGQGKVAESPNEADALVGCVEMARRLGLSLEGVVIGGGALELLRKMLVERSQAKAIAELTRNTLQPGRLHAIHRPVATSGKLHRRYA